MSALGEDKGYEKLVIQTLTAELSRRKKVNQTYSLRAFARDLKMNPGYLSSLLQGTRSMPLRTAFRLFGKLGYSDDVLADLISERSDSLPVPGMIQLDSFSAVSDWHHYAIVEMVTLDNFKEDPKWIGKQLGIKASEVTDALKRLLRVGLLKRNPQGKLVKAHVFYSTTSEIPSNSIKNHHSQILEKAKHAIWNQEVPSRHFLSTTMAIPKESVVEIKSEIEKFNKKISRVIQKNKNKKTEVYEMAIQFFDLKLEE